MIGRLYLKQEVYEVRNVVRDFREYFRFLYRSIVSISIPLNPMAESPSTQITRFVGSLSRQYMAAAIAKAGPTPIVPKDPLQKIKNISQVPALEHIWMRTNWLEPASRRWRGSLLERIERPISIVLAPSLTMMLSNFKTRYVEIYLILFFTVIPFGISLWTVVRTAK